MSKFQYYSLGHKAHACWDWTNIQAAQKWCCPCRDRASCISKERIRPEDLLIHRKDVQVGLQTNARDAIRNQLAEHYNKSEKSFSRSFVVGSLNDCCAASAGIAGGFSWATWSRARTDLTKDRPRHKGRAAARHKVESDARRIINAYIRDLRASMTGSKGGSKGTGNLYTGKRSLSQRWQLFRDFRIGKKLPTVGSLKLFSKCWKEQENIVELSATGHSKCDECAAIQVLEDNVPLVRDSRQYFKDLSRRVQIHQAEHRGERDYGDDMWHTATCHPDRMTMLNMDAPTSDQLEIPVQARKYRDISKGLEESARWLSKMMGVMIAGIGMLCFIVHQRMGGGANLSCTSLYLTLLYMVENNYAIGSQFRLLLDNTCSENKCNEVIFFIGWLVAMDYFDDASFFCMLKGHTYTSLDQTFNTMIMRLRQFGIYCLSSLIHHVWEALRKYHCHRVIELHALWDWVAYFKPHVSERLGGFTTGQFGSGMHEFYCRKDSHGKTRLWLRKSSQASSWLPEGPGMEVFASLPTGEPPLAPYKYSKSDWKFNEFQGSLRQWLEHMPCEGQQTAEKVRKEWERTFADLPDNDDPNLLAPELKPKWDELPTITNRPSTQFNVLEGVGNALENPPINPVTGPGRTATEVRRETLAYRSFVRRSAGLSVQPVFQQDYLFVQIPSKPMFLARVVNHCNIDDALSDKITFTVGEYVHEPQQGITGFFGTFSKAPNDGHNPHDTRSGGKFIRHANITRREVVLYDVQTWVDRLLLAQRAADEAKPWDCVRVEAASLRKLAHLRTDFILPGSLPSSHIAQVKPMPNAECTLVCRTRIQTSVVFRNTVHQ